MGRKSCVAIADVRKRSDVEAMIQTSVKELGDLNTMYGYQLVNYLNVVWMMATDMISGLLMRVSRK